MFYKKIVSIMCCCMLNSAYSSDVSSPEKDDIDNPNKSSMHIGVLFLKPGSNNLDYASWVSGIQPYYQSWHHQMLKPASTNSLELGLNFAVPQTPYSASVDWMHLNSSDSSFKQATRNIDLPTLEFVAPLFEMSPPVFGIKRADSTVKFNFDNVDINVNRVFNAGPHVRGKVFGGLNVLSVRQKITTVFSDYPGSLPTPYSYALPADPSYSFEIESRSKYVGAGPDLGLNVEYNMIYGVGLVGQVIGTITAGTTSIQEQFSATSARLTTLGIGNSHQEITTPNKTQVVPGFDGKLGVFYHYSGKKVAMLSIEGGYRILSFINAISTINPNTLVQPGTVTITPEFSTGTMAIVSTALQDRPFNMNGPYIDLKLAMN